MKNWTLELSNGSQLTLYEHAIAYIQWRYDDPRSASGLPDKCNVILQGTGQTLEFWRDQTRELYRDIVSEKDKDILPEVAQAANLSPENTDDPGYFIL